MNKRQNIIVSQFYIFVVFGLFLVCKPVFADGFKITPFVLYEEARQNIVIEGVSTKYALGVAGVELRKNYGDSITISSKLGYGQNNNQKTSFAGANFSGKVTGSYFNIGGKYEFYKKNDFTFFSSIEHSRRNLDAPNLIGKRNNLDLTGIADTTISSEDLKVGITFKPANKLSFQLTAGMSNWHIKSDAKGYYVSSGLSATASKSINTKGSDPIIETMVSTNKDNHNFALSLSDRSLRSKTNTSIITGELNYEFHF